MRINFITNIRADEYSGGHSGVNAAAYAALQKIASVNYVGPINPPVRLVEKVVSKFWRLAGGKGSYYFFSPSRLRRIAKEVAARTDPAAELDYFHGFTSWILCRSGRPYVAWNDCSFQDYISIFHDRRQFQESSIRRICASEAEWMTKARPILVSSDWAARRMVDDYGIAPSQIRSVGIFGAMAAPDAVAWRGSRDFYFISTDYEKKNGRLCRQALDHVWKQFPDVRLRIIGARPPDSDLVPGKVTYEGFFRKSVPAELAKFREHLGNAFVLLHPTDADTTAMIVIEASFFGCPAISVDDFALREVTSPENHHLLLARPLSAESIAAKIIQLLRRPEEYLTSRHAARAFATAALTPAAFESRLQQAVGDAMANEKSASNVPQHAE